MTRGRNIGLGIDWNLSSQDGLIVNRGEDLIHEIGMRCVCNNEDTYMGVVEQNGMVPRRRITFRCTKCNGDGYIYRNPERITAIITGIRQTKDQAEFGWLVAGDCLMSLRPGDSISGGDKLIFTWPLPLPDGQVIVRGAGSTCENDMRETGLEEDEDRLWYNAHSLIWCEDEDGSVYDSSSFLLNGSKIIKWLGGSPNKGKKYVIKYNAYIEWIAFFPADCRIDRGRDLGARAVLRKKHIALVNENPGIRFDDRTPFCDRLKSCK